MKQHITVARIELNALKKHVIGIFKIRQLNDFELVLKYNEDNNTLDTLDITQFGIINESFGVPLIFGTYKEFPNQVTMEEMLLNPFEWDKFIKSFK